jgi:hypothetical protein
MAKDSVRDMHFTASNFDRGELDALMDVLRASGLDVWADYSSSGRTARVEVRGLPEPWEAERARTRYAGRRSTGINPPEGSIFNRETPCADFLAWQEAHTATEGMEQLGLSRTTYFQRLKQIRAKVEEDRRINAERDRSPEWEGRDPIVVRLGDVW